MPTAGLLRDPSCLERQRCRPAPDRPRRCRRAARAEHLPIGGQHHDRGWATDRRLARRRRPAQRDPGGPWARLARDRLASGDGRDRASDATHPGTGRRARDPVRRGAALVAATSGRQPSAADAAAARWRRRAAATRTIARARASAGGFGALLREDVSDDPVGILGVARPIAGATDRRARGRRPDATRPRRPRASSGSVRA